MKVFITGSAGFIGFHLARRLLEDGDEVLGYDGMTEYYDVRLKEARLAILGGYPRFRSVTALLEDRTALEKAIGSFAPEVIIHLAAQAGVRDGLRYPERYVSANLVGTFNLLEAAQRAKPGHLLIASTSSVYGANPKAPFEETDRTDFPVSLYAATKRAGEAMSHTYAHLFGMPTTCFRFFTVYGPWGRPDMAYFKFVAAIEAGEPIDVYGSGDMRRDFTYIDDLVEAIVRLIARVPKQGVPIEAPDATDTLSPVAPWRVVNIGGGAPVGLMPFIAAIEKALGKTATKVMKPMQPGDVTQTFASARLLEALTGIVPSTPIEDGIAAFVAWYREWKGQKP